MSVRRDDVEQVARLAALSIDDEQLAALTKQIQSIISYVAQLEGVPTAPDDIDYRPGNRETPLRADEITPIPLSHPPAEMAPAFRDGFFIVPKLEAFEEQG